MPTLDTHELATELLEARRAGKGVETRPSSRDSDFDMPAAYRVVNELARLRQEEGHTTNGRKIGFTNKALWPRLEIDTIVWGYTYDDTVHYAPDNRFTFPVKNMIAPKIEPEIVFKLKASLSGSTDPNQILQAVEWVALGFEIVDCPYPNWRFRPVDMVAAFGFHSALVIGQPQPLTDLAKLAGQLAACKLTLKKNGEVAATGAGSNVLDSPALSLGQVGQTIGQTAGAKPLGAGEVVTSGTLTDAMAVSAGEEWSAETEGLDVPTLTIKFA